uniref:AlNc14C444G11698 protein n=1 Tax=Albugo laibachii Nc14 TaxID=890382 RepID=F0WZV7_9STRA|nr:AlNc14C444G11698 [Albugo laibachii Nc14]|eukprot:CCA27036.1 AlNc14C444G11698 [Albugo laibachii Nc14]
MMECKGELCHVCYAIEFLERTTQEAIDVTGELTAQYSDSSFIETTFYYPALVKQYIQKITWCPRRII